MSCAGPPSKHNTISQRISAGSLGGRSWSMAFSACVLGFRAHIWMQAGEGRETLTPMLGACARDGKGATAR